jgi:hypothetical protein
MPHGEKHNGSWRVGSFDVRLRDGAWVDWDGSSGRTNYSLIDLWLYLTGSSFKTGIQDIESWIGAPIEESRLSSASGKPKSPSEKEDRDKAFSLLERPTQVEIALLSALRSITPQALWLAVTRGFLWMCRDLQEQCRAWVLTDSTRRCAIARRLDGKPWQASGKKAKLCCGSEGNWTIGLNESVPFATISIIEGSPDFLSSLQLRPNWGPICMASANMHIPECAVPRFKGKRVWIFAHDDEAGLGAASRWKAQLAKVAYVKVYRCKGDLNEMVRGGKL